jgi:hypothetical protein
MRNYNRASITIINQIFSRSEKGSAIQGSCQKTGKVGCMKKSVFIFIFLLLISGCGRNRLKLQTENLLIEINENARITSLRDITTGKEYLAEGEETALVSLEIEGEIVRPSGMEITEEKLKLFFPDEGEVVVLKFLEKPTHIVFEAVEIVSGREVDLLIWGPYPTTISESVGECVGVVRNNEYAIGIQSLNVKTLGGYPVSDDDSMPSFNIFAGNDYSDIDETEGERELYRGNTAKLTPFGSTIQAYCRNRGQDRVIANLNHERYVAKAFDDGGVAGSKIALFGCPSGRALETIGEIEIEEGLPHPELDGVWGKESPTATASYLIVDFSEANFDEALEVTKKAGLKYLYHGGPFKSWGNFGLDQEKFPDNWDSMKRCVERAEAQGIYLGVHTLSNFINTDDPYVTPVPDPRLGAVGSSVLSGDLDSSETEIEIASPDYFNQFANNNLRTVMIEKELIRYGGITAEFPWRLTGCVRGAFGTRAADHPGATEIFKLVDHGYKTFLAGIEMQGEVALKIAELFNYTGLRQISFDGLEGCLASGMGQYARTLFVKTWFDGLNDELRGEVINDASNPGHYFWHIYTRMNWGEPWYAGFRESQTQYRLKNQNFYERNLMPHMLGWFRMTSTTTIEDAEWLLARAAGFDAGFGLSTSPDVVRSNGFGAEILEAAKEWERARFVGAFNLKQKELMKSVITEFHLEKVAPDAWDLYTVDSSKFVHTRKVRQPGEPLYSSFSFINQVESQPVSFIISAEGSGISGISIEIDHSRKLEIPVSLEAGETLKYSGNGMIIRYDAAWQEIDRFPVDEKMVTIDPGDHTFDFDCKFGKGDDPKVKIEIRILAGSERVQASQAIE